MFRITYISYIFIYIYETHSTNQDSSIPTDYTNWKTSIGKVFLMIIQEHYTDIPTPLRANVSGRQRVLTFNIQYRSYPENQKHGEHIYEQTLSITIS